MQLSVLQYLEQPSLLSEVTLDEVLSLADRFPYATTLHLLVLLKARQINSPDFEKYLNRFAASTFDRAHLYNFLATLERQDADGGEVLELLQLEDLELAPLAAEPFGEEALPSRLNELHEPTPVRPTESRNAARPEPPDAPEEAAAPSYPAAADADRWVANAAAYYTLLPRAVRRIRPEDPDSFASAGHRREPLASRLQRLRHRPPAPAPAHTPAATADVVVSETLAALLVRQGQYQSALRMYERLSLLYPEKKPIFAGLINELKGKL